MIKENIFLALKPFTSKLRSMKRLIYKKVGTLDAAYSVSKEPIPFNDKEKLTINCIKKGDKWGSNHDCGWFHFQGFVPVNSVNKKISVLINIGAEGCLFDRKGKAVNGISNMGYLMDSLQPVRGKQEIGIVELSKGGEIIDLWIESGYNKFLNLFPGKAKLKRMDIVEVREDIRDLYYDYLSLISQYLGTEKGTLKRKSLQKAIKLSSKLMKNFKPENVKDAGKVIEKEFLSGETNYNVVYATGHAHLDLAWLWPIRETKRKSSRTFSNQLRNLEKYDNYIFGASQPQLFQWLKEEYSSLYEEVKIAVAENKIEIQGGMWVEPDTNIPSGESLIRQNLYGMEFWEKEFGKSPKICWLPDVFGFSGNLPQIVKKCNMDYFLTIKLSWNNQNKWPHSSFIWEGIDNSKIIIHLPPMGNYSADGNALSVIGTAMANNEKEIIPVSSLLFGNGDGGGGAGEGHMESITRAVRQAGLPKVILSGAEDFFKELEKYKNKMITHKGELYLEKHQGTFTTQAKTKLYNRKCEQSLHDVEYLSVIAAEHGYKYPKNQIEKIWKEVLLYQFHDIIPGSSISRVYTEAEARYPVLLEELNFLKEKAVLALSKDDKPAAINSTSFVRNEYVKYRDNWYEANAEPYSIKTMSKLLKYDYCSYSERFLESNLFKLEFNSNGEICSLISKKDKHEHCKEYFNRLSVYRDKKLFFNAWDIDIKYTRKKPDKFKLSNFEIVLDGPSVIRTNTYKYNKSKLIQKIILTIGKPYIEFETEVNWQETHKMLRADFKPATFSNKVRCDIQFGNIMRSTEDNSKIEKAQFEICAHKWIDVEDGNYGLSLLNDSKYGHRVKNGLISLNLLRSTVYPASAADKGIQKFNYAIYPYKGKFDENNTQEYAYAFNNKLSIVNESEQLSLVSSNKKNIVIETVKKSQDGNGTILRVYENQGRETKVEIKYLFDYGECFEASMLEVPIVKSNLMNLHFTAFEIKTLFLIV